MKLLDCAPKLVLVSSLLALLATAASPAGAQEILYYQPPLPFGGSSSNGLTIAVADDFRLTGAASLEQVVWWGGYGSAQLPRPTGDAFTMRIFGDDGGQPGQVLAAYTFGAEVGAPRLRPPISTTSSPFRLRWRWKGTAPTG
jgi:hypothetical protein